MSQLEKRVLSTRDYHSSRNQIEMILFFLNWLGYEKVAKLLIHNRADVNAKGLYESAPLHLSAQKGNSKLFLTNEIHLLNCVRGLSTDTANVAKLLITNGASVNPIDKDGESPLHVAALNGKLLHLQSQKLNRYLNHFSSTVNRCSEGGTGSAWKWSWSEFTKSTQSSAHSFGCRIW